VENVFIEAPEEGLWSIEVAADNIAMDGDEDTEEVDQPFALVVSGVISEEHELSLGGLELDHYFEVNEPTEFTFQLANIGLSDESDLTVELRVNDKVESTITVDELASGLAEELTLGWTPTREALTPIAIHVQPVEDEARTYNNWLYRTLDVYRPVGKVLFDEAHANDFTYTVMADELETARYHVFALPDGESLTDLALEPITVLVVGQPQTAYTTEELEVLQTFIDSGGGLLVNGDDSAATMRALTDYAGIDWTGQPGLPGSTNQLEDHPVNDAITQLYFNSPNLILEVSGQAQDVVWDETPIFPNLLAAAAPYGQGRLVAISDSHALNDDYLNESDNLAWALNIFGWLNNQIPVPVLDSPEAGLYPVGGALDFDGGSSYDPEGNELTYLWESDREGQFGTEATFSHTLEERGPHTITLTVNDGFKSASAKVDIVMNTAPEPLILVPLDRSMALPGDEVTFEASDEPDPDGDAVTHRWESSLDGLLSEEASFTRDDLTLGEHTVTLTSTDIYGVEGATSILFFINNPPTAVISEPLEDEVFRPSRRVTFAAEGSTDGETPDLLTYSWTSDLDGPLGDEDEISTRLSAGAHVITLTVDDGQAGIATAQVPIMVNTPPQATLESVGDTETDTADSHVDLTWTVNDPDSGGLDIRLYHLGQGEPQLIGLGLETSGTQRWSTADLPEGWTSFKLVVDDGFDTIEVESKSLTIYHAALHPDYYILDDTIEVGEADDEPMEGDELEISFTVVNPSPAEGRAVLVTLYLDDPDDSESLLHEVSLDLPAGGQRTVTYTWTAQPGEHLLFATIQFEDEDISNNQVMESFYVANRPVDKDDDEPDLMIVLLLALLVVMVGGVGLMRHLRSGPEDDEWPESGPAPAAQPGMVPAAGPAVAQSQVQPQLQPQAQPMAQATTCPTCWQPAPFQPAQGYYYCHQCAQWLAVPGTQ